jgi:hypothetical protein
MNLLWFHYKLLEEGAKEKMIVGFLEAVFSKQGATVIITNSMEQSFLSG